MIALLEGLRPSTADRALDPDAVIAATRVDRSAAAGGTATN
jgi:hypothetical protein